MSRLARAAFLLAVALTPGFLAGISKASVQAEASSPPIAWRFQAASPVSAAPAVASSGNVYLASLEGVVHALAADGHLRWSYGVSESPIGEPSLDARERVYLATSTLLHSFQSDGRLRWRRQGRARIRSGAVWLAPGRVLYLGGEHLGDEQALYALSTAGDAASRIALGGSVIPASSELFTSPGMVAALATGKRGAELWRWSSTGRPQRLPLPVRVRGVSGLQVLSVGERLWLVLAGELHALEPGDSRVVAWSVPARQAAVSADGEALLIDTGSELRWLSARSGETVYRAPLPETVSAALALTNAGVALVPLASGELLLASPGSAELARVRVGAAPLLRPIWSETAGQATVASGDGALVVLQLRGWSVLEPPRSPLEPGAAVAHSSEVGGK